MFDTSQSIGVMSAEMQKMFLQMVVMNVLSANVDDHFKNCSFTMDSTVCMRMSPGLLSR